MFVRITEKVKKNNYLVLGLTLKEKTRTLG